jgi:hypothetical protein
MRRARCPGATGTPTPPAGEEDAPKGDANAAAAAEAADDESNWFSSCRAGLHAGLVADDDGDGDDDGGGDCEGAVGGAIIIMGAGEAGGAFMKNRSAG